MCEAVAFEEGERDISVVISRLFINRPVVLCMHNVWITLGPNGQFSPS